MASAARPRRPNRSAAERRQQYMRAEARSVQRLLCALGAVSTHKGQQLGSLGAALAASLETEKAAAENAAERQAAEKATAERLGAESAEAKHRAAEKAEAERQAAERTSVERLGAESAEANRRAAGTEEAERQAAETATAERLEADKTAAENEARSETEHAGQEAERTDDGESQEEALTKRREVTGSVAETPASSSLREYIVDNSQLHAASAGLAYRASRSMDDRADTWVPWGGTVLGADAGEGWLLVQEGLYLPFFVDGTRVLRRRAGV